MNLTILHAIDLLCYVSPGAVTLWTTMHPITNAAAVLTAADAAAPAAPAAAATAAPSAAAGAAPKTGYKGKTGKATATAATSELHTFPTEDIFELGRLHVLRTLVPGSKETSFFSCGKCFRFRQNIERFCHRPPRPRTHASASALD